MENSMNIVMLDIVFFVFYVVVFIGIVWWVLCEEKGYEKDINDYFFVGLSLLWWVIGVLLIVVNIFVE